ncbi:MAG: hypothetical protein F6K50_13830 [Moorea sp. SIO3I7]|uniref:hypothetical protein n=1 Tax=unclassified Moorena TaxID=2683338 RepID=UPI0013C23FF0|nr:MULTISPECIES: hypothetical protein [unclassified Moorena]NEN96572.1 hypothetical protein [Moorena sp. SIO3I7]NEO05017.1 hypothetical protein [Moorena sp. SIO3I8]NEO22492.1 hypothetical protein [Moorena sp. SIO4A5]NEP21348.1 hypothetical protein [Moorena sp. SIO3I6]NEQ56874.1 hypothetical protein [Moorena sp. SIO4A1]
MPNQEEDPLKSKLEKNLQESQWLHKFKQLSQGLSQIKTEIPLTQLCKLEWVTATDSLIIHCPNSEVRDGLCKLSSQIAQITIGAKCFILRHPDYQDITIKPV